MFLDECCMKIRSEPRKQAIFDQRNEYSRRIQVLRSCRVAASSLTKPSLNSTPVAQWPVRPKNEFPDTPLATVGVVGTSTLHRRAVSICRPDGANGLFLPE